MARAKTPTVFLVSDSRGDTARQLVRAAAVQFEGVRYRTVLRANVRTLKRVQSIVGEAQRSKAVIFYTLVNEDARREMRRCARQAQVSCVDILGPAFSALHHLFHRKRGHTPGLLYALDREQIDRMDAIDYTLKHDDGQRPHELSRADVVVVGVSRASKSTTCFYLASAGVRAANVPLVAGLDPPEELFEVPSRKVVGLRVEVSRLLAVRGARAFNLRLGERDPYIDRQAVVREVAAANRLMDDNGWRSVDVSYLAVEEIAREVMRLAHGGSDRTPA
ncbi:MAG: pyruvate, phosphate dikinase/phosphoenolpyruvate synthase regulator [Acidobacteria bacterium]|nr:pyruvate, phosphate dikinase/phosphoenolpyruvate synthase regulator [Acidobacteriota bacterium]NIM60417.1 pyruvate, phosphate dikinase/phosphoenolpyruvate synthase regulator [Acidobacteriota bacterium]NIO58592.1 pyruvate, phosphate dikinase/phosphoenolpyruvate synthase regulator [Acidobacteriota bacterium]NIQ29644.1 pyruvate, phosphate dikinase/phosphoenolpyruvate synthase regulator [Acidobacteriota bacterium]NIQ84361.1 pyruvate, phosphate dikinase/phosphoenolpyruvate synthase regulator [Aci